MGDRPERLYAKPLRANELVERPEVDDGPLDSKLFLGREEESGSEANTLGRWRNEADGALF